MKPLNIRPDIADVLLDPTATPYELGYKASTRCRGKNTEECPYPKGSEEANKWWDGFGDSTEDAITHERLG